MFNETFPDLKPILDQAKALHAEERKITLQSVRLVAELDSLRLGFI